MTLGSAVGRLTCGLTASLGAAEEGSPGVPDLRLPGQEDALAQFLSRGRQAAARLLATAGSLCALAPAPAASGLWGPAGVAVGPGAGAAPSLGRPVAPPTGKQLGEGLQLLAGHARAVAPFVAAAPALRAQLGALVAQGIAQVSSGRLNQEQSEALLSQLAVLGAEPEALRDLRSSYRIALTVGRADDAKEVVTNRSPAMALSQLAGRFPELLALIQRHVEEFGWVRTSAGAQPASAKEVLQRIQMILLRWPPQTIAMAAEPRPPATSQEVLGFVPGRALDTGIAGLQELTSGRPFSGTIWRQADAVAGPFWEAVGQALGCPAGLLHMATAEEIAAALAGESSLLRDELEQRRAQAPPEPEQGPPVTGQSVSLGRALGRVRIMYGPMEVPALEMGDVLVTAASTPDKMGTESTFPTREGAPPGIERVAAIVADEGGLLSHAATISRELGIPCIVGTERGTRRLKDGQMVEVDATREQGQVLVLDA